MSIDCIFACRSMFLFIEASSKDNILALPETDLGWSMFASMCIADEKESESSQNKFSIHRM